MGRAAILDAHRIVSRLVGADIAAIGSWWRRPDRPDACRRALPTKHGRPWRSVVSGKNAELLPPGSVNGVIRTTDGMFAAAGRTIHIAGDRWIPLAFDEAGVLITHPRWWDAGYVWRLQPVGACEAPCTFLERGREPGNAELPTEYPWLLERLDL